MHFGNIRNLCLSQNNNICYQFILLT